MTAPDPAFLVAQQLFPPGPAPADAITLYEGATKVQNGFAPWRAWDLRGPVLKLAWDLLRFQLPTKVKKLDPTLPIGLRDSVNRVVAQVDENNAILRAIAVKVGADLTGL